MKRHVLEKARDASFEHHPSHLSEYATLLSDDLIVDEVHAKILSEFLTNGCCQGWQFALE
jgi:hypothetical protein